MLIAFRAVTTQIEHRGARGHEREALIAASYLQHYVPPPLKVVHGAELLDSLGSRSAECDLVVQSQSAPPLAIGEHFHLVPIEWAYGVIEVKSQLGRRTLRDAQQKIARAKSLRKLAFVPQHGDVLWSFDAYGRNFDYFPLYGLIFAFSSSNLTELCHELWRLNHTVPMDQWVDAVVVLDKGLIVHERPGGPLGVRPYPGCQLRAVQSDRALLSATLVIHTAFSGVFERPANLGRYLGPIALGGPYVGHAGPGEQTFTPPEGTELR